MRNGDLLVIALPLQEEEQGQRHFCLQLSFDVRRLVGYVIVVSKKQAEAIGDALAQGHRSGPQRLPYRMRFFPELERIPADDRDVALNDAKRRALRSIPVIATSFLYVLLFAAVYYSHEPGSGWIGSFITAFVAVTSICGVVFRWRVRRELLRSSWRPRVSPLSAAVSTTSDE